MLRYWLILSPTHLGRGRGRGRGGHGRARVDAVAARDALAIELQDARDVFFHAQVVVDTLTHLRGNPVRAWLAGTWTEQTWLRLGAVAVACGLLDVMLTEDGASIGGRNNTAGLAALQPVLQRDSDHLLVRAPSYLVAALLDWPGTTIPIARPSPFEAVGPYKDKSVKAEVAAGPGVAAELEVEVEEPEPVLDEEEG